MNVEDVKAVIRDGREAIGRAQEMIEQIASDAAETESAARATSHDSEHSEVVKGLNSLGQAIYETELTIRRLDEANDGASQYLAALG
ncbi:hypothetical protein [Micromonospora sp. NBC_01796]|uniref:hypothetical protein n=1 Tax=Micromonospora sp. NBC_01796 TaxID=2975987 RepID=UPI002DDBCF7B|nr:hypothetical protein [Micromonospora sp. NBC_01796]WSA87855.1 hypothetical protein OIE47_09760 [Micromonospora sp. NBC_01796]